MLIKVNNDFLNKCFSRIWGVPNIDNHFPHFQYQSMDPHNTTSFLKQIYFFHACIKIIKIIKTIKTTYRMWCKKSVFPTDMRQILFLKLYFILIASVILLKTTVFESFADYGDHEVRNRLQFVIVIGLTLYIIKML